MDNYRSIVGSMAVRPCDECRRRFDSPPARHCSRRISCEPNHRSAYRLTIPQSDMTGGIRTRTIFCRGAAAGEDTILYLTVTEY